MWPTLAVLAVVVWLVFAVRARLLARTIDRAEAMVLKPLSLTYLLLAVGMAVSGVWLVAAISALAVLINGAIGASLHRSATFSELAEGTLKQMQRGPRAPVSHAESHQVAGVLLRASVLVAAVLVAVFLHGALRWYVALPAAVIGAWGLLACAMFLAAYQRKPAPHSTATG